MAWGIGISRWNENLRALRAFAVNSPKPIQLILAVARNGAMGLRGGLPWKLPDEYKYFLEKTRGGILIHGRHSQDQHGRPLPEREVIVLSRQPDYTPPPGAR